LILTVKHFRRVTGFHSGIKLGQGCFLVAMFPEIPCATACFGFRSPIVDLKKVHYLANFVAIALKVKFYSINLKIKKLTLSLALTA